MEVQFVLNQLLICNGRSVSQWIDKSDNNLVFAQSTQAAQPTYDSINSKVSFDNQSLTDFSSNIEYASDIFYS